jgi:hypothetical protein
VSHETAQFSKHKAQQRENSLWAALHLASHMYKEHSATLFSTPHVSEPSDRPHTLHNPLEHAKTLAMYSQHVVVPALSCEGYDACCGAE